jgi:hypothetical protein
MLHIDADKVARMASPQIPNAFADFMNVLVLVALPAGPVNCSLSRHAIDSSPDGVMVNVFNDVAGLPRYHKALETRGKPDAVVHIRLAAAEADAVHVVTSYRGRVPLMAHNAIDWMTRRWRHGALLDKPFAIVGRSSGCYKGVLSRPFDDTRGGLGPREIEPLTVRTLWEAVKRLADEVHGGSAVVAM